MAILDPLVFRGPFFLLPDGHLQFPDTTGTVHNVPLPSDYAWVQKSADYTANTLDQLMVDTTSGAVTITLPANPALNQTVLVADAQGTWDTNPVTIARNGKLIGGTATNLTLGNQNEVHQFVYVGGATGWRNIILQSFPVTRPWQQKSASFTAKTLTQTLVDTTGSAVTVTLPAAPSPNDTLTLADAKGTFNTNNLTINPNGNKIATSTSNVVVTVNNSVRQLVYVDDTFGWRNITVQ